MYFEKLELIGFKSFAEKTKLQFEPGVTVIVGPNGCGKSNIADAIRWVLGEQSVKAMRASRMDDVIFNGTDSKEPINFAEVSLALSNRERILSIDYDEVTISRRIYRSGENEYLLNKTPVRLKDISELLMGTGIGTESYSIIEQGKIDLILSSRPEDRRFVFEEASGITKYKSKKREALRKLEETENNLVRIGDIIHEVKRQISSIERQARKAEKYKMEFDKLKDLELKLAFFDYRNLKTEEKTSSVEIEDMRARELDLSGEIEGLNYKISQFRLSLEGLNEKISNLKSDNTEALTRLDKNSHKVEINKERIEEAKNLIEGISKEAVYYQEKISKQRQLVDGIKSDQDKLASEIKQKLSSMEGKEAHISNISTEVENLDLKVKKDKSKTIDLLSRGTHIRNELVKLASELHSRRARLRRLNVEKEGVVRELQAEETKLNGILAEFGKLENRLIGLKVHLDSQRATQANYISELKSLDESLINEERRKSSLSSKLELLTELIKRREGFMVGVKAVLAKKEEDPGSFGGVCSVLADLLSVEKGYEDAVEAALGMDAQLIVVKSDRDALNAISYLKEHELERARFISIEASSNTSTRKNADISSTDEKMKPLRSVVKTEPGYDLIADGLLSNTYLVEDIEEHLVSKRRFHGLRLVTRSGMILDGNKIVGGGKKDEEESGVSIIGRKDRAEALRAELEILESRICGLANLKSEKLRLLDELNLDIKCQEDTLNGVQMSLTDLKAKRETQEEGLIKLKEEISMLDLETDEINQLISDSTEREKGLGAELNVADEENVALQRSIEESQTSISNLRQEKEEVTLELTTLIAQRASLEKEISGLHRSMDKEGRLLVELSSSLTNKEDSLKESSAKKENLQKEILGLEEENRHLVEDSRLMRNQLSDIEKERSDVIDKMSIEELQLKENEDERENLRNRLRDIELKVANLDYRKRSLKERMEQSYKVDIDSLHAELEDGMDWDGVKLQIEELKGKLENIGPVNLIAIDEHRQLEERSSFLVHQQEDLVNAKESLHKAISKINKTTKELFLEAFQKIRAEFKSYFKMLFGGGQAELVLIDDQDVLESGIEIVVRPPGKKLQNLMLLSGGEKALTAIAILFAIFKIKPSPFCVLDEIDAPLDESNIGRFSKVLQDFVKMSQFIIITHNKKTIELAHVMYGITMQERGVSKIVSVKFLDAERDRSETSLVKLP